MKKIKIILISVIVLIFSGLVGYSYHLRKELTERNLELSNAVINNKAYEAENDKLNERILQFNLTVDQLNNSNDSIVNILNQERKKLKIKNKQIRELEYLASTNQKTDTLILRDTIIREGTKLDTLIKDDWSSMHLQLSYPNKIVTDYSFENESIIIAHDRRETIKPPKKCAIGRWFQKKHTVVEIEVIQKNPYCKNKKQKHIKIIE